MEETENKKENKNNKILHPYPPPSTEDYDGKIGGLLRSPALVTVQSANSSNNVTALTKIGALGYLFRGITTKSELRFTKIDNPDFL